VRPSRIETHRLVNLCEMLMDVGSKRQKGVHHWKSGRVAC
jgi:hypothetical protein